MLRRGQAHPAAAGGERETQEHGGQRAGTAQFMTSVICSSFVSDVEHHADFNATARSPKEGEGEDAWSCVRSFECRDWEGLLLMALR